MTVTPEQVLRDTPRGSRAEANFVGLYPINDCGPVVGSNWFFYPISLDGEGWHYINPATGNPFTGGSEFGLPELPDDPDYSLSGDTGNYGQGANNGTTPDKKSCAARLAAGVQNSKTQFPAIGRGPQPKGAARNTDQLSGVTTISASNHQIVSAGVDDGLSIWRPCGIVAEQVPQPASHPSHRRD